MDSNVLQNLRSKLKYRLKRFDTEDRRIYPSVLKHSLVFFGSTPILKGILDDLEKRYSELRAQSESMLNHCQPSIIQIINGEDETENAAINFFFLKALLARGENMAEIAGKFYPARTTKEIYGHFNQNFIVPLFDYLDEQLDDRRTTLHLLRKYKQRVEWFQRDDLFTRFKDDTQRGEKGLAKDLYAYLHDQGLEFSIEPSSVSGEADLVASQTGTDRLVADVKIFNPQTGQNLSYLHKGFHQVYQYTKDYHTTFGYLIIFKTCEADLSVNARDQDTAIPFFTHNNKTIFVLVIDIFPHPTSASQRGKLKSHELLEKDLIQAIENPPA